MWIIFLIILFYLGFKFIQTKFIDSQLIDLDKKVIFITGSDSGIGNETAKYFHKLGFIVFAGCLDPKSKGALELNSLNQSFVQSSDESNEDNGQIQNSNNRIHIVPIDITQVDSISKAIDQLDDFLKQNPQFSFHCLINNAGVCIVGEYDWLTLDHMEKIININLIGTLRCIKLFLKLIIKHKSRILIIGSVNGIYAYPGISVYCATKSALNLFSQSLRFELKKFEISVHILNPGDYANKTNIMANQSIYFEEMIKKFSIEQQSLYKNYIDKYIELTNQNIGVTGRKNSDQILFNDLNKLVTNKNPPYQILSVPLINRIILFLFFSMPINVQVYIFQKVWTRILKLNDQ